MPLTLAPTLQTSLSGFSPSYAKGAAYKFTAYASNAKGGEGPTSSAEVEYTTPTL